MKVKNAPNRLSSLWGYIDKQHCQLIESHIVGKRVLDVGCGYGSLTHYLGSAGYDVEGIDYEEESISMAKRLFPDARIGLANAESLNQYPDRWFDTVVLKDSLHHVVGEGDSREFFKNIRRLLKENGRVVILDPNPQWILRIARRIVFHKDPEASVETALCLLKEEGFQVRGVDFFETIGLILSGGYVGVRLVPNFTFCNRLVASTNQQLSKIVNSVGLGRQVCWRYIIHADLNRPESNGQFS